MLYNFILLTHVPQSPKKEPDISLHLSVCTDCREYIVKEQRLDVVWYNDPTPTSPMEIFVAMDTSFSSLADVIETVVTLVGFVYQYVKGSKFYCMKCRLSS